MGRERLMEEQRARMEARRKQLKKEVEKAKAKKVKKAVTRDTSKDQSRKTVNRLTGSTTPKTGESAKQTLSKFAGKKPAPAPKAKPVTKNKPVNKVPERFAQGGKGGKIDKTIKNEEKAKSNFFYGSSGTRGSNVPSNPKLKSQNQKLTGRQKIAREVAAASGKVTPKKGGKPKNPKKGQTYKTFTGITMVWTGTNWKQKTK